MKSEAAPDKPSAAPPNTAAVEEDQDDALAVVGPTPHALDPVVTARVVRKIDLFLMPLMVVGYGLVYCDKAILGSAALFGMTADLHLAVPLPSGKTDTRRLSWATSLFHLGIARWPVSADVCPAAPPHRPRARRRRRRAVVARLHAHRGRDVLAGRTLCAALLPRPRSRASSRRAS